MEIDLEKIEAELGIGKEVILELLKEYLKEAEGLIQKLEAAVSFGNYASIAAITHTLKGLSGNLRVTSIQEMARAIELAGKEKKDRVSIEGQVKALKALHEELRALVV